MFAYKFKIDTNSEEVHYLQSKVALSEDQVIEQCDGHIPDSYNYFQDSQWSVEQVDVSEVPDRDHLLKPFIVAYTDEDDDNFYMEFDAEDQDHAREQFIDAVREEMVDDGKKFSYIIYLECAKGETARV